MSAKDATITAKAATMSAKDATMSAKDATMSAKDATMSAKGATMNAKGATMNAKDATMSAKDASNAAASTGARVHELDGCAKAASRWENRRLRRNVRSLHGYPGVTPQLPPRVPGVCIFAEGVLYRAS